MNMREGAQHIGELQAWDLQKMEKVWTHKFKYQNWGPVLTTGGGLVFLGGTNDRYFRAFDAKTGAVLWEYRTNSGVTGVPSSYAVDGCNTLLYSPAGAWTPSACKAGLTPSWTPRPMCHRVGCCGSLLWENKR